MRRLVQTWSAELSSRGRNNAERRRPPEDLSEGAVREAGDDRRAAVVLQLRDRPKVTDPTCIVRHAVK